MKNGHQTLSQVISVESGVKNRAHTTMSEVYKALQHPGIFDGFHKKYRATEEGGESLPPEQKLVQLSARQVVTKVIPALGELFDLTATKDYANCEARADVMLDGTRLVENAPVTYLLFLEKQLTDLHTLVGKLPVLDPAESWDLDPNTQLHKTGATLTARTKKTQRPIVLYPATTEHPAQTQLITEDVTVGHYEMVKVSGAIQAPVQAAILGRIEKLQKAVKFARETANAQIAPHKEVSKVVLDWLFGQ